jgi:hypothetical protein
MTTTSATLILSGIGCLGASGLLIFGLGRRRREDDFFLTRTEGRAMAVALTLIVTIVLGVGSIVRGLLG